MFLFLLICSLLVPLSMVILGYKWQHNPPHNRDGLSGYRTTMSRQSDETWKYAHKYWGRLNFFIGIILVIVSIIVLVYKRSSNFEIVVTYLVFIQLGIMALTIIPTEISLNTHFTNKGIKK